MQCLNPASRQKHLLRTLFASLACLAMIVPAYAADPAKKDAITEAEVNAAQQAWCDGLVKIGKVHKEAGDYKAVAAQVIHDLYDYNDGKVFFKPTLAFGKNTFRPTREGALSYFVGGGKDFPEDTGFALLEQPERSRSMHVALTSKKLFIIARLAQRTCVFKARERKRKAGSYLPALS